MNRTAGATVAVSSGRCVGVGVRRARTAIVVTVAVAATTVVLTDGGRVGVAVAVGLVAAGAAAWVDAAAHRLPDPFVAAVLAAALVAAHPAGYVAMLVVGLLTAAPVFAVHCLRPDGVGFGDVKLLGALGALVGPVAPAAPLLGLAGALTWMLVADRSVGRDHGAPRPLGPPLVIAVAALVALAFGTGTTWHR